MIKKIAVVVVLFALVMSGVAYYMWNKPHPTASSQKSDAIFMADDLAKEYNKDEKAADAKYLNKTIEVTGVIGELDKNQDGGILVVLQTSDPSIGIQCAMVDKGLSATKGQTLTIKGFCSGNGITGISLNSCEVKK